MKNSRLIVGLMSGTSLDGIDAVLLRVEGSGAATRFEQRGFITVPFPWRIKALLLKNSIPSTSRVDEIARLNMLLGHLYADAVRILARKARVRFREIDLVGSHGQTIQHLPAPVTMAGRQIRATLQIGDPSVLATLTGITTVGDFRIADMAVGGEGAPLVPYFDWLVFRSPRLNRILLNIGGIGNITILPKQCRPEDVTAFDTGPGNMVIDALMRMLYEEPFDRNGRVASRGMVSLDLLKIMARHPYLTRKPPKSTGREEFGKEYLDALLVSARGYDPADVVATATEFTAYTVSDGYRRFVRKRMTVDEVLVSGGGARNRAIVHALERYFDKARVLPVDEYGMDADAKEATCFAILANETMSGHPANIPGVTGARQAVVLGKVCRPTAQGHSVTSPQAPSKHSPPR
jgi:anhydro-N-acetylmuramic acid kinase